MIYFTRKLYDGVQDSSGWSRLAEKQSKIMRNLYSLHLRNCSKYLPIRWKKVFDGSLHDAVITKIDRSKGKLDITLNCRGTMGRFRGKMVSLKFKKIIYSQIDDLKIGDWWLYNEIHVGSRGKARVLVLLQDSEIDIEADNCNISVL